MTEPTNKVKPSTISDPVESVRAVTDPIARAAAALEAMQQARKNMGRLRAVRQEAVRELVTKCGGTETARLLGISRTGVYRLLAEDPRGERKS